MAKYCFVRHGQTNWNIQGKWQGHTDIGLNETGVMQAKQAANQLLDQKFSAIYSSDLSRALQTAEAINSHHGMKIVTDQRLREQHFGEWEGLGQKEVPGLYPQEWEAFVSDPIRSPAVGGESMQDLADRMLEFYSESEARHREDDQVLVVAHGLSLAVLMCALEGQSLVEAYKRIPANATPIFFSPA